MHTPTKTTTNTRLLAKVLREVLQADRFESLADLTDVLKTRAARLHLRVTTDEIGGAFHVVGSNVTLVSPRRPAVSFSERESAPPLSKAEAARIRAALIERFKEEHGR